MAGALRAEVTLAVANGVYVILLLIGGVLFPLHELGAMASFARLLPTAALSDALHRPSGPEPVLPGGLGRPGCLGGSCSGRCGCDLQVGGLKARRGVTAPGVSGSGLWRRPPSPRRPLLYR